jgi:hypothetical protein
MLREPLRVTRHVRRQTKVIKATLRCGLRTPKKPQNRARLNEAGDLFGNSGPAVNGKNRMADRDERNV